ncbi:hypothetical protein [Helicobacter pylori]|uniref:hypothetical protein n=1 Tax=Helicobacter pylori TaxID=210 RepID=UPI000EB1B72F|nr:hypothetical protein [Helicobacter pylori]
MFSEKILKVIPALLFLFSVLSVFELFLIIEDMNKTEKIEIELKKNLEVIETFTELLNMQLEKPEIKRYKP